VELKPAIPGFVGYWVM